MERNLSLELRPQRLSELVAQGPLVKRIRDYFAAGRIPVGVLLSGPFGSGKTTIARILGLAVNCPGQKEFGELTDQCIADADYYNIIELNCADLRKIEDVRTRILPVLSQYPSYGDYRVWILSEAQQMTKDAQQVLLKPFEDKDSHNIFIFDTSDPTKIDQALRDRCVTFPIGQLDMKGVEETVQWILHHPKINATVDPDKLQEFYKQLDSAGLRSSRTVTTATEAWLNGAPPDQAVIIKDSGITNFYALFDIILRSGNWDKVSAVLETAKPDDGEELLMRFSAHLRKELIRAPKASTRDLLSIFIRELVGSTSYNTGLQLTSMTGAIYRICRMVEYAIQNSGKLPPADLLAK